MVVSSAMDDEELSDVDGGVSDRRSQEINAINNRTMGVNIFIASCSDVCSAR